MGAILMGNLPFAEMEYFSRKDGYPTFPEGEPVTRYQRWVVDMYYMDLDGIWKDELAGIGCTNEGSCTKIQSGSNGILDTHYKKDGSLGTDEFDIWVSRVNPYGEAIKSNGNGWDFVKAKDFTVSWLYKAIDQQNKQSDYLSQNALFYFSEPLKLYENEEKSVTFIKPLSELYPNLESTLINTSDSYINSIGKDYDWITYSGHSNETSINNQTNIYHFNTPITVKARGFHLSSCSALRNVTSDGIKYQRTIGYAHLFRTLNGGVTVIGATKTSGGSQDNDNFYNNLKNDIVGKAFLKWTNHRTLVYDKSVYKQEVYDWFYPMTLIGDPFLKINAISSTVKKDVLPTFTLYALNKLNINDGVICYNSATQSDEKCNVGSESSQYAYSSNIGSLAEVGDVYSRGGVQLRSRSSVNKVAIYNNYNNALLSVQKTGIYNILSYRSPMAWTNYTNAHETLDNYYVDKCRDVNVTSSNSYFVGTGDCIRNLKVESNASVTFGPGQSYIGNLQLDAGSKYEMYAPGSRTIVHVKNYFSWRAKIKNSENDPKNLARGFKLILHGSDRYYIDTKWYGSIYAPNGDVVLAQTQESKTFYGSVIARNLTVHQYSEIFSVPFNPINGLAKRGTNITDAEERNGSMNNNTRIQITAFNRNEIKFNANEAGAHKISVMNIKGDKIASFDMDALEGHNSISWNGKGLARGLYLVNVKYESSNNSKVLLLK
ncbi:MAG: hypothetical protein WCQ63_06300 [Methanomethylophilus sp.]